MSIKSFLLKSGLAALVITVYGCNSASEEFEPPKKKQSEERHITKEKQKNPLAAAPVLINKIEISKTAIKYRNINEVETNGISGNGFLTNINFVTRWNILGAFPYKTEKDDDNKLKSVLHDKLIADEKKLTGGEKVKAPLKWQLARFESPKNREKSISEASSRTRRKSWRPTPSLTSAAKKPFQASLFTQEAAVI